MATSGPNQATTATEVEEFENPWTDLAQTVADDGAYGYATTRTNPIDFTGFGTFTDVSSGATISSVLVEIKCEDATDDALVDYVQLIVGGVAVGDSKTISLGVPASVAYCNPGEVTTGGAGFNYALTGAQANASNFGVRLTFRGEFESSQVNLYAVRVTLTYTVPTTPTHATSAVTAHNATTPKTASAGTRTAGDLVVVLIQQVSAGSNTYTVSDDLGNTYSLLVAKTSSDNRYVAIYYSVITTGGSLTASVAATGGIAYGFTVCAATPPSGKVIAADASSSFEDASTTTSHNMAAVGAIDTTTDVIVYGAAVTTGNTSTVTDPTSFTLTQTVLSQRGFAWRRESASALTDERGNWSSASNTVSTGVIASFKAIAPSSGQPAGKRMGGVRFAQQRATGASGVFIW